MTPSLSGWARKIQTEKERKCAPPRLVVVSQLLKRNGLLADTRETRHESQGVGMEMGLNRMTYSEMGAVGQISHVLSPLAS